jgi:hypothetical protein
MFFFCFDKNLVPQKAYGLPNSRASRIGGLIEKKLNEKKAMQSHNATGVENKYARSDKFKTGGSSSVETITLEENSKDGLNLKETPVEDDEEQMLKKAMEESKMMYDEEQKTIREYEVIKITPFYFNS